MTRKHHPSLIDSVYDSGRFPLSWGRPPTLAGQSQSYRVDSAFATAFAGLGSTQTNSGDQCPLGGLCDPDYTSLQSSTVLLTHWCGLRVGEVAALRIVDVVDESGAAESEIVLTAAVTKSNRARRIFVPKTMQQQLKRYVSELCQTSREHHLFSTQKN